VRFSFCVYDDVNTKRWILIILLRLSVVYYSDSVVGLVLLNVLCALMLKLHATFSIVWVFGTALVAHASHCYKCACLSMPLFAVLHVRLSRASLCSSSLCCAELLSSIDSDYFSSLSPTESCELWVGHSLLWCHTFTINIHSPFSNSVSKFIEIVSIIFD